MSFPDRWVGKTHLNRDYPWIHARILMHGAVHLVDDWVSNYMSDPQWRVYCNLEDGAEVTTEHGVTELEANRIYVLPAWLRWKGVIRSPVNHMFFGIDIPLFSMLQAQLSWNTAYLLQDVDDLVTDWQTQCFAWQRGAEQTAVEFTRWYQIMYRALEKFFQQHPPQSAHMPNDLRLVTEYIEQHLGEDLNNERLAEVAYCSSGHLIRTFGKLLNQTPANYVRERRLTAAAHRLAYTDDSIDQIAEELGFPNRHYLTRVFTKTMGCAPARYRKLFRT